MGQQRSARGARRGHDEKEERDAHRTPAEIDDSGQPPEESGRDERDSDQQDRLRDEFSGKPPVAKPTTRPEATIVGKLRHGRNTSAGDGPSLKSLPHHRVARKAPTMARPIANFCGSVSRSSIQKRRTRIATIGYAVVKGTTIAIGPSPIARKIVIPAMLKRNRDGIASRIPPRSQEPLPRMPREATAK